MLGLPAIPHRRQVPTELLQQGDPVASGSIAEIIDDPHDVVDRDEIGPQPPGQQPQRHREVLRPPLTAQRTVARNHTRIRDRCHETIFGPPTGYLCVRTVSSQAIKLSHMSKRLGIAFGVLQTNERRDDGG
jgi:hypothetical protein